MEEPTKETKEEEAKEESQKELFDKIAAQSTTEITENRTHKQGKISNWAPNEDMYYNKKVASTESRANVNLGRMAEFVHTLLSKIDNPLIFKFKKRKNAQLKRVERLNALRQIDSDTGDWDIKDLVGKKQAIIYGRAVYCYYADSVDKEYGSHLEPIDVYDFLIDKNCGGLDIEEAQNLGDFGLLYNKKQLEEGIKNGSFIKENAQAIIDGTGDNGATSQESTNKRNRTRGTGVIETNTSDPNRFRFWRWCTTYEGVRYYVVINNSGQYIKVTPLSEMFSETKQFPLGAWPYWTWAAFPDMTEFWTPSYCDYVRELFQVQNVSINQLLDNSEAVNKPQKVVNVNAFENLAELKYRKDGVIRVKDNIDVNAAYQIIKTQPINTPIEVFNLLESIAQKSSGVTDVASGVSDEAGKVGIYEGNKEAEQDRFGLLNKSYSFGYKRFAKLYEIGVRDNLTKKVAIELIGIDGVEEQMVSRRDIFKKGDDFSVLVEASNAETLSSMKDRESKIAFLEKQTMNTLINQKKRFEMAAKESGLTEDEITELLDTSYYGNSELMSECDRDIEDLLDGKDIKPNRNANNAYKQKMVNYLKDHEEDMNMEMFAKFTLYITSLDEIIMKNEVRSLNNELNDLANKATTTVPGAPGAIPGSELPFNQSPPLPNIPKRVTKPL